ncbi:sensory histidine kinase UhpB [compost metagenome]
MVITDNGKGFNTARIGKQAGHYGLIGLSERARLIGGDMEIRSGSGGTTIRLTVPIEHGG